MNDDAGRDDPVRGAHQGGTGGPGGPGGTGAAGETGWPGDSGEGIGPVSVPRASGGASTKIAIALCIVGSILVAWFALSQTMGSGTDDDVNGAGADDGAAIDEVVADRPECPVPEPGAVGAGPLAGVELPCLGADHQGTVDLGAALAGSPAVINVWVWNCAPCREELPVIEDWAAANPDVRVVGVQASTSAGRGAALLEDLDVDDFASYQDDLDAVGPALELPRVVPITVVLRADGSVAEVLPRAFDSIDDFDAAVRGALA